MGRSASTGLVFPVENLTFSWIYPQKECILWSFLRHNVGKGSGLAIVEKTVF